MQVQNNQNIDGYAVTGFAVGVAAALYTGNSLQIAAIAGLAGAIFATGSKKENVELTFTVMSVVVLAGVALTAYILATGTVSD